MVELSSLSLFSWLTVMQNSCTFSMFAWDALEPLSRCVELLVFTRLLGLIVGEDEQEEEELEGASLGREIIKIMWACNISLT